MSNSEEGLEARFTLERERGGEIDEPPFRILVMGDWSGDGTKKDLGARKAVEIDRDNFDHVLARFGPRLTLEQPDGGGFDLEFSELDDFHPDQIFNRLPMFARLRDLRKRLLSEDTFNDAARELRSWFKVDGPNEPQPAVVGEPAVSSSDGLLDAILSGSAAPAPKASPSGEVADLVKDLVRPHLVSVDEHEQAALLAAVDAATSDLMKRILHDHKFQALEAAWRGLYLLVRRAETSTDLKILVLNISKDELRDDLRSVSDLSGSVAFKRIVEDSVDVAGAEPWAVIVGNYAFLPDKDDIASLMRLAKIAAVADAPFISHMRPDVLGVQSLAQQPDAARWNFSESTESGKLWAVLRGIPEAQYLALTIPRYLSRLPYGRESEPLETFQFEEFAGAPDHDKYLWSNTAFLAALLMSQSFSEYGWHMDRRFIQDIERLPMHMYEANGEKIYQPCAEVLLTQNACERMMEYGLMPLVSYKNTDHVKLARFQSIADPVSGLRGKWY